MNVSGPLREAQDVGTDVVCLGESMVTFRPTRPGRLADVPSFERGIGGAESNVACALALAGHRAKWVSRVGSDGFGDHLVSAIAACGVDTSGVGRDSSRPTGIYFRTAGERATGLRPGGASLEERGPNSASPAFEERGPGRSPVASAGSTVPDEPGSEHEANAGQAEVAYYRAGSAASAMSSRNMDLSALAGARVLHLSGITAALSADCLALMRDLTEHRAGRPLVSFDVNYRVHLWAEPAQAGPVLLDLARRSDLVFVGEDEAEAAWGITGGPVAIRAALPEPATLVVKQGARGATAFGSGTEATYEPAPKVDVVAAVGAGDAFAAGFLSATLRALPVAARLRHGHLMAAAALTVPGDLGTPPARADADRLAALPAEAWGTLRLGPGSPTAGAATGEVVTT
ncbi:sugar kinase [Streptomyces monticola]|uniref:Sugar kinase n=1 Tax=Streptomyces monticola TaxID=2666263 RepID=A0ABW2JI30_9ACTN